MATKPITTAVQAQSCPVLFYGIPDVARALGIGQTYCWALLRDKKLPCTRLGRRTLVSAQALADFAASLSATSGR